ncbi:E3 ubiquitin-protein ligase LRSAM1-like isoform X1 [Microplitis mediator]|uniref:E3 ubiquitin-protein ligase LRSAM1-like isoform X1 n=1 Tax=Microplitis mediator TaxID=375433 RepID=UPI0025578185|nr:E3 ubiquitin-protein ligase LRSAM1-like isoform X1 [Microplitis mediator]
MSFRKHANKNNVDYKARLEHKLYLARENPEPIFDISNCALKTIPSGIFTLCKVFRKKELKLNKNKLTSLSGGGLLNNLSLITLLDISDNEFTNLPSEIYYLSLLEELYMQNNNLKKLPTELTELSNLQILNVANNKLNFLPESIGNLKNLNILDISDNSVTKLPKSLGEAQKLIEIKLDNVDLIYPPSYIVEGGAIAIVAYLAQESGINYAARDAFLDAQIKKLHNNDNERLFKTSDNLQVALMQLETSKERRQNALLEVEKNIREQQEYELQLQSINKGMKKKLLEDLVEQQTRLESEIERVQQERELNRSRLLSFIYHAEKEADTVIEEFLRNAEAERLAQAELVEMENKEQLELLSQCHLDQSSCRTRETLLAMEELLGEELLTEKKVEEYTKFRDCNAQSLLTLELRSNDHLASIVENQKQDREELLRQLRKDEVLQKAALAALLERSDTRSWSIVQQVNLIQSQLVVLTNIELERKKLEITQQINDIAEKRIMLSNILVGLLEQQDKRRAELLETINKIELRRDSDTERRGSLFWLMQYQSLMEARPQGLLEGLEPMLVRHVAIAGALHCLPFLASLPYLLPNVDHDQLKSIGVNNADDRQAIILAVENYNAEKKLSAEGTALPAPIDQPCSSSTNSQDRDISRVDMTECVVCLDSQCEIIFLPCGHLCCCAKCSNAVLNECPLCRGSIQRKIQVHKP